MALSSRASSAIIMIANWRYTLSAIMPIIRQLEATPSGRLVRWGQLHPVRSVLGAVATVVYLIAAARGF